LRQCKAAMRLTYEDEDLSQLSEDEQNGVVVPCTVHARFSDHSAKQAMAFGSLKRCKGTLNYLKGLCESEKKEAIDNDGVTCSICLAPFEGNRAVLRCGHSIHVDGCLESLQRRSNGRNISCPFRCRIQTEPSDIMIASNQSHDDGTQRDKKVEGSFGTKVTRLVSDIFEIRQKGEKGVVFSQWEEMMDIIEIALTKNNVHFVRASGPSQIGKHISEFRSTDCTILLMNVKNGGEGLTLHEANHVFMVEPLMNAGMDRQGRERSVFQSTLQFLLSHYVTQPSTGFTA
jgi:E3 ubiquitin-protein ligase SHPRH